MKKFIAATLISAMALFAMPNNEIELLLISKAAQKKAVVLANMDLQGETKEAFGKLYDQYQRSLMQYRLKELDIIGQYAQNYKNMNDDNANKLITEWVTAEEAEMVLKKEYVAKFKKILPSADVIRYFQIENRLQLVRELQRATLIPLAQPAVAPEGSQ